MKLTLASILLSILAIAIFTVSSPPYERNHHMLRFTALFAVIILLLSLCLLPWVKGTFSEKWPSVLKFGLFTSMLAYDLGYITFALSSLI
jgi:hypothetical protein